LFFLNFFTTFSLTLLFIIPNLSFPLFAADGFKEFSFGDSSKEVRTKGIKRCQFSEVTQDSRWTWKSYINCTGYRYKGTRAQIFFEFVEDELVKYVIISKRIPNYYLVRNPTLVVKTPIDRKKEKKEFNLADELMLKDKVHVFDETKQLVYFFHQNRWEWELTFFDRIYHKKAKEREIAQLETEVDQGLKDWKGFAFEDPLQMIKDKLDGLCSSTKIRVAGTDQKDKILQCLDFPFSGEQVIVEFLFSNLTLQRIEVLLEKKWYLKLIEPLKKKYGTPYSELEKNPLYYPYLQFTKVNVLLAHRYKEDNPDEVIVFLRYIKEDYSNPDDEQAEINNKGKNKGGKGKKTFKSKDINSGDL